MKKTQLFIWMPTIALVAYSSYTLGMFHPSASKSALASTSSPSLPQSSAMNANPNVEVSVGKAQTLQQLQMKSSTGASGASASAASNQAATVPGSAPNGETNSALTQSPPTVGTSTSNNETVGESDQGLLSDLDRVLADLNSLSAQSASTEGLLGDGSTDFKEHGKKEHLGKPKGHHGLAGHGKADESQDD